MRLHLWKWGPGRALCTVALLVCGAAGGDLATAPRRDTRVPNEPDVERAPTWHVKTHVFATNMVLADVQRNGTVTIPPFGEFAVNPELVQALRLHPDDYRSGVVGPDVFPDIFVGQSFAHVDHWCDHNNWIADDWMRQAFDAARNSKDSEDLRLRRLAFAYGFLTHGAQDMFGHTFINHYVGAKWGSFTSPESLRVDAKHVVLEAYVAKHTPISDLTINVDDEFQTEHLIKPTAIQGHTLDAPHYQSWLKMYGWLGRSIEQTFNYIGRDTSWSNCYLSSWDRFEACQELYYMIGWHADIDHGLHHLVDANQVLGEALLAGDVSPGIDALMDWKSEWLPKIYGLHALGEFDKAMGEFTDWWNSVNPLAPVDSIINKAIMDEVQSFLEHNLGPEYAYFQMILHPSGDVDQLFAHSTVDSIRADMHMGPGPDSLVSWGQFDALYNTIIASKLVLLDGDGLNELARRAGLTAPLYGKGPSANIMIGVMRSMDGDHQWDTLGDHNRSYGLPFSRPQALKRQNGVASNVVGRGPTLSGSTGHGQPRTACGNTEVAPEVLDSTGYAFFQAPEARAKIFQYIFRGWGLPGAPYPILQVVRFPFPLIARRGVSTNELARDLDPLQRDVGILEQHAQRTAALTLAQRAVLTHPQRGAPRSWGRICCSAPVQTLRSDLTELESTARDGARVARRSGDARSAQLLARVLAQTIMIDNQAGAVLQATDPAAARRAVDQVKASVGVLGTLTVQWRR